jgi:hypothetical protein
MMLAGGAPAEVGSHSVAAVGALSPNMNRQEHATSGAPADTEQRFTVLVADIKRDACGRQYYSAVVPRLSRPLPACPDCGGSQRLVDLIVG